MMEQVVIGNLKDKPLVSIITWQMLIMIMSSARFDDGLHVTPATVVLRPEGLQCRAWQTKTDRPRRNTQLVVCRASLGGFEWLRYGFECWKSHTPAAYHLEDFFLFESDGDKADFGRPITYAAFADNLRSILHLAVSTFASDEVRSLLDVISTVTAHSMRCTITSAMAHHSFEHKSIQIQGQWKDSSMVEKYTRDRDVLKLKSLGALVADVKATWREADIISGEQVSGQRGRW